MGSAITPAGLTADAASGVAATKTTDDGGSAPVVNEQMFLKLLVAQIQNQNPMSPADGIEFLSQLAQFTGVEQMLAMRQELETIRKALTNPEAAGAADSASAASEQ
jgi:flagellar basal-body rod modification protein FlgD